VSHINERTCAEQHLRELERDDVVVYDRGYYSYLMLHHHFERKIHPVFRLQRNSSTGIDEFFAGPETDSVVPIMPSRKLQAELSAEYPNLNILPIPMRLIKYQIADEIICLGTTLLDQNRYTKQDFIDVYHSRWGVEELYKVSKRVFIIEDFHAQTERGVKQEIFAHFALVTMNRIFANQADTDLNLPGGSLNAAGIAPVSSLPSSDQQFSAIQTNFKSCIHVFTRSLEELLFLHTRMKAAIERVFLFVRGRHQKARPGRSCQRKSMRPITKWQSTRRKRKRDKKAPIPLPTAGGIIATC
jgi:hypothetical protein